MQQTTFSSKLFSFARSAQQFTTEISLLDMPKLPREFYIQSEKTGNVVLFKFIECSFSREREILFWKFKAYDKHGTFTAIIFND